MKIILMMAMTVDGKIAKGSHELADWTSPEDKKKFREVTQKAGVVIMGANTFRTFPSPLKDRLNVVFTQEKNPKEIEGVKWVSGEPQKVLEDLEKKGYSEAILGGGASINSLFLKNNLIDEILITIEPKIFGDGLSMFSEEMEADLKLLEMEKINEDSIMLRYKVVK